ncbi:MAG TPA: adenosine deaminase [Candidatus Wallbacteria bacterium]|nr:adenosine deaminase [Candidatus Wallbacteria bacterium]
MNFFESLPKIELHIHLEGAIPYDALFTLIKKYGGAPEIKQPQDLAEKFIYRDFSHFIQLWSWKNRFLREYEDFRFIAERVARSLKNQNVRYAEMFVSPSAFKSRGLSSAKIIEQVAAGFGAVSGIRISLIVDLVRDYGADSGLTTLYEIEETKKYGVIGIGLGGSEGEFPPELFIDVFEKSRKMGFKTTVHAGEAAGAYSVKNAVEKLLPDRIGHGLRAADDENLLKRIAALKIPLELCPISNIKTGSLGPSERYPLDKFIKSGIAFSINTDDPEMFGNSLAEEYSFIENELGYTRTQVCEFALDSINTSWLPEDEKNSLKIEFSAEYSAMKSKFKI